MKDKKELFAELKRISDNCKLDMPTRVRISEAWQSLENDVKALIPYKQLREAVSIGRTDEFPRDLVQGDILITLRWKIQFLIERIGDEVFIHGFMVCTPREKIPCATLDIAASTIYKLMVEEGFENIYSK